MGFTKMEGTTVNAKDKIAYSALQNSRARWCAGNALNVPGNVACRYRRRWTPAP